MLLSPMPYLWPSSFKVQIFLLFIINGIQPSEKFLKLRVFVQGELTGFNRK